SSTSSFTAWFRSGEREFCSVLTSSKRERGPSRQRLPRTPVVQVLLQCRELAGFVRQPLTGSFDEFFLLFPTNGAGHDPGAQEHEVGVQRVERAVIVDLLNLSFAPHCVDLVAGHV